jgi:hypothetical protein
MCQETVHEPYLQIQANVTNVNIENNKTLFYAVELNIGVDLSNIYIVDSSL